MKAAIVLVGFIPVIAGVAVTFFAGRHTLSVGKVKGSAGPVMIIVGVILIVTGILLPV